MHIGQKFLEHISVDTADLKQAVSDCPNELWHADMGLKDHVAGDRPTQSMFLHYIKPLEIYPILRRRALKQQDVPKHSSWKYLHKQVAPLMQKILQFYPPNGVVLSLQIARMPPGAVIPEHTDISIALVHSHRLHIPIQTNSDVMFYIEGERVVLEENILYEINNCVPHSVENRGTEDRLHLIVDYLPPDRNTAEYFCTEAIRKRIQAASLPYEKEKLPKLLATSVVRGAAQSESHGGIYLVDMQTSEVEQKFDWDNGEIDFQGRGWDRGLRGIAFYNEDIYIAASDEIFCFDQSFNIKQSYKNKYLKHAHEISVYKDKLYVTSTGFDSILRFDLSNQKFDVGWCMRMVDKQKIDLTLYDPNGAEGPEQKNTVHINQVCCTDTGLYVSGRNLPGLMNIQRNSISQYSQLPLGSHNAQLYESGILLNDTKSDRVVYFDNIKYTELNVPGYHRDELEKSEFIDNQVARQSFGRGLCVYKDNVVFAGSSPSTISAYDLERKFQFKTLNISMDVRNAIHGLELWPY